MAEKVLVVDDRPEARKLIAGEFEDAGFDVRHAVDGLQGWEAFQQEDPALVVTDLRMPRADGIELLQRIRSASDVPVIVLTAYGDVPTAVSAMKQGAQEFLSFPDDLGRMLEKARTLLARDEGDGAAALEDALAGRSSAMQQVRERVASLAQVKVPVLVIGESGAGRDTVVRAIHRLRHGPDAVVARVDCTTAASRGALTPDAAIYLDEVGRLPEAEQAFWYRVIDRSEASNGEECAPVFASTWEDLTARAREGAFHAGLAEALARFTVSLPPLRERLEDLDEIAPRIVRTVGRQLGLASARIEPAAIELLRSRSWPGNVRELAQILEKAVAFSPKGRVTARRTRDILAESSSSVATLRSERNRKEREELIRVLEECGGNLAEAGRRLRLSRGAVIYRAQKHGLLPKTR